MGKFVAGIALIVVAFALFIASRIAKARIPAPSGPIDIRPGPRRRAALSVEAGVAALTRLAAAALAVGGVVLIVLSFIRVVSANSVGIPTTFGKIGGEMSPGLHVTAPWTEVTEFSTRTQELSMLQAADEGDKKKDDSVQVIAKGAGSMKVDATIRFSLDPSQAVGLFRKAASLDLVKERFVRPEAREVIRNVFGQFSAEEGYSSKRAEIASTITAQLKERLAARGIVVDTVNIRDVAPDQQQLDAINAILKSRNEAAKALEDQKKLTTEAETRKQVAQLDKEAQVTKASADAESVRIAAEAQAKANQEIAASLTDELVRLEIAKACANAIATTKAQVVNVCAGAGAGAGGSGAGGAATSPTSVIVDSRNPGG